MSRRKYSITVKSFSELVAAYPLAVTEKIIPEVREKKEDYSYIAGLLDRNITVPGIEFVKNEPKVEAPIAAPVHHEVPHFIGGKK